MSRVNSSLALKASWALRFFKVVAIALGAVAFVSILGLVVAVLSDPNATGPVYLALININLIFALVFIFYIGKRFTMLFIERQKGLIGTRLHLRLLATFGMLAILPSVIVGVFSLIFLNQGIEAWFSSRVTQALDGAMNVAQSYLEEHSRSLLLQTQAIGQDTLLNSSAFRLDTEVVTEKLQSVMNQYGMSYVSLHGKNGELIAHSGVLLYLNTSELVKDFQVYPKIGGQTVQDLDSQQIAAIVPLSDNAFLVTVRWINAEVLSQLEQTKEAYGEYYTMRSSRDSMRWVFGLFLALLTFGALAGAIRQGLKLAGSIIHPVTDLVHATNRMSSGDLDVRLTPLNDDELGILTQSFNRMAGQLKEGRTLLEKKNKELTERRRAMEAVLTGVSAGVLSVEVDGKILLANQIAEDVLNAKVDMDISEVNFELAEMVREFAQNLQISFLQKKIRVISGDEARTLLVRIVTLQRSAGEVKSVVITFDDITELLSAQKVAAWSDVARRIAHEIKNPLTPIQLSAERLRRKYAKNIPDEDKELFSTLTETIVNQVEQMRVMVNEFSDFARMPAAKMSEEVYHSILDEVILLQQSARSDVKFTIEYQGNTDEVMLDCDRSHLTRLFTNLIENAVNAIEEKGDEQKSGTEEIKIVVGMSQSGTLVTTIADTGKGLPEDVEVDKLFDPYVTTRKKGTGLGLAIVRRVVDEHGGQIRLCRREEGGTMVEVIFPLKKKMKE